MQKSKTLSASEKGKRSMIEGKFQDLPEGFDANELKNAEFVPVDMMNDYIGIIPIEEKQSPIYTPSANDSPYGVVVGVGPTSTCNLEVGDYVAFVPKFRVTTIKTPEYGDVEIHVFVSKNILCRVAKSATVRETINAAL